MYRNLDVGLWFQGSGFRVYGLGSRNCGLGESFLLRMLGLGVTVHALLC